MKTKQKIKKERIYTTRINGEVVGYIRHHSAREAQALYLRTKVETDEASIDDLMRIGAQGIEVMGLVPDIDPNQRDLPI